MMHIVFNEADVDLLNEAMALDESLRGSICLIRDDYAVGPLDGIYTKEGLESRRSWQKMVLEGGDYDGLVEKGLVDDQAAIAVVVGTLRRDQQETVWIWAAQNAHDVCGYYWLLHYLKEFSGRIFILYLNNLPFINEKGQIFYPLHLSEILPREFLKAKKLAREITASEFEVDPDEWEKLVQENRGVRLLEGGKKLVQADYDAFDDTLKKYITGDWQKVSRVIHQFLSKEKRTTGDAYLLWRIKVMLAQEALDIQGKPAHMKDFEIKRKA